ncbi:hypothetical protein PGTUg99_033907 [Puccinia graminis f. sp. tritici]|uniref:Uncharacterized protein n=1 Tax=Puccinia graminis f. sp. tritici TaxID=56615 RepID=A0A5B0RAL0_PUCGR|nr:hypothetical protein PGTUg99_033907 [Puccinia graminis f. sp. tritici]
MTTQSLIPPTSREGFQRLLSRPSDALIPFLNSILAGRLTATITSIADTVQVIRSAPVMSTTTDTNQPERISQSLEQELRISELQSSRHQQQQTSPKPSTIPTEHPEREDKAEDSDTICYALVARTDKSEQIDVEISKWLHEPCTRTNPRSQVLEWFLGMIPI